jgi:hypothetical protein
MSDLRFNAVVTNVSFEYKRDINRHLSNPKPSKCRTLCSTCGRYHDATFDELTPRPGEDELQYVASMRAWNCCHEEVEPYDGFPEAPIHGTINSPD